jgi:hypothetical protein
MASGAMARRLLAHLFGHTDRTLIKDSRFLLELGDTINVVVGVI